MIDLRPKKSFILFLRRLFRKRKIAKLSKNNFKPGPSKYITLTLKTLFSLLISFLLVGLLLYFLLGDFFKITQINCEKGDFSCSDQEKILINDFQGENIFLVKTQNKIELIKKNFPKIGQVIVTKKIPHTLLIKIILRNPIASFTQDEKNWYLVDDQGYLFDTLTFKPKDLPQVYFSASAAPISQGEIKEPILLQSLSLIKSLKTNFVHLDKIMINNNDSWSLLLTEGTIATISARKDINLQVDSLQFILRQSKIEGDLPLTIDLRFDKPVVIY